MTAGIEEYRSRLRDALATINQLKAKVDTLSKARSEPVAIVGMGCRLPGGSNTPEDFFRALDAGIDAITQVPESRWAVGAASDDPSTRGVRWGAFVDAVDAFDADFFGISPREVVRLDPQQRFLLEVSWEALERAGLVPSSLLGSRSGVFLGLMTNDYALLDAAAGRDQQDAYSATGNGHCFPAGRISYTLGLQGPSLVVDTACSSSLVALHIAALSLRAKECDVALVGGVNLMLSPETTALFAKTRALSPDGRCKTFDASANGYVRGEGCGVLVLERLSDAKRRGAPILAVVRGSAVNQDGRSTGLTTPNVLAQEALIRAALENAGLSAADIGYVETHGTGTPLGDPIEIDALRATLGDPRADGSRCVLGAVKTNIGHLEAAAGIASLIKAVMALQNGVIPANQHFRTLNPRIDLEGSSLDIATSRVSWGRGSKPRRAGVSSFGLSGTNAHVILEEAPQEETGASAKEVGPYLVPLSAKTPVALSALAKSFAQWISTAHDARLHDIAYTASTRRTHHEHRLSVVGETREEIAARLHSLLHSTATEKHVAASGAPKVVFVFPGQGSQWLGMGRDLLSREPAFREALEACDREIRSIGGFSVLEEISADESRSRLGEIDVVQPLLFAIEVALAALWRSWGVEPHCIVGHSMGEVAAAHVAGMLSLSDASKVACLRSRLLRGISGKGAMALVELPMAEAEKAIAAHADLLSVAVSNGPRSTVISGDGEALDEVIGSLEKQGVFSRRVKVDVASHSPQVEPLRDALLGALREVSSSPGKVAMRSTVTGNWLRGGELSASYWWDNLRQPVRFSEVTQALMKEGHAIFIEMSPHPLLLPAIEENLKAVGVAGAAFASMRRQVDGFRCMLEALGALHVHGYPVEWGKRFPDGGRVVALPAYPWQRERFWIEAKRGRASRSVSSRTGADGHPLLGELFRTSGQPNARYCQFRLGLDELPFLADHRIGDTIIAPGSLFVELALAAVHEAKGPGVIALEDVAFVSPLVLREGESHVVEVALSDEPTGAHSVRISSHVVVEDKPFTDATPTWTLHVSGLVRHGVGLDAPDLSALSSSRERCRTEVPIETISRMEQGFGLNLGPAFRGLREVRRDDAEAVARLELPAALAGEMSGYLVHPALLDAALRVPLALPARDRTGARVLAKIGRLRFFQTVGRAAFARAELSREGEEERPTVTLFDDAGHPAISIEGIETASVASSTLGDGVDDTFYFLEWREAGLSAGIHATGAGSWLILCDDEGFMERAKAQLAVRGERVMGVRIRRRKEGGARPSGELDPTVPEEVFDFLKETLGNARDLRGIVFCAGFSDGAGRVETPDDLDEAASFGCGGALHLVQALSRLEVQGSSKLWLVVRGTQDLPEHPHDIEVSQAPLWGLGRTIAIEYPALRCARVDVDPSSGAEAADGLVRELLSDDLEDEVALRGARRYVARITRQRISRRSAPAGVVVPHATYLITGGLGGLGFLMARWLVDAGAKHIVLVGRHGVTSPAQAEAVEALSAAGAEVVTVAVDVADPKRLGAALRDIGERMPPLRGVVHAAGVLEDGLLEGQTVERFRRVFSPKVLGAWNLHVQTQSCPLDFFVMYSSMAALFGPPGLGNYVAANSFLDALAHHRRRRGLVATSIDWGLFTGVGMGVKAERQGRMSEHGIQGFGPQDGEAYFWRILGEGWVQVGAGRFEVETWQGGAGGSRFGELSTPGGDSTKKTPPRHDEALLEKLLRAALAERLALLEKFLREQLGEILRMDPARIDRDAPLRALGVDSLMSLELRNRLEASLGIQLSATLVWSYPNVAAQAEYLASKLPAPPATPAEELQEPALREGATPGDVKPSEDDLLRAFDESMKRVRTRRRQ